MAQDIVPEWGDRPKSEVMLLVRFADEEPVEAFSFYAFTGARKFVATRELTATRSVT